MSSSRCLRGCWDKGGKGRGGRSAGFSLVEVTLALAVAGFCMLAIIGLLQTGLSSEKTTVGQTAAANLMSLVYADLSATPKTDSTSRAFGIALNNQSSTTPQTLYFTEDGGLTGGMGSAPTQASRYRVTVGVQSPAAAPAPKTSTQIRILVTWPALAAPNPDAWPASTARTAEVITALDRN
ncbi:MAG: hypothetical protein ACAI35_23965 [Candidatus Methylacidiphilales bacterium]|nr:hypothetical protein [Candidatus Methylacidiphilales bacterium]